MGGLRLSGASRMLWKERGRGSASMGKAGGCGCDCSCTDWPFAMSAPVRWATTAGSAGRTATARSNGSSTSSQRSTRRRSSPRTVTPAAGTTASPWVNSGSVKGTVVSSPLCAAAAGMGQQAQGPHPSSSFTPSASSHRVPRDFCLEEE